MGGNGSGTGHNGEGNFQLDTLNNKHRECIRLYVRGTDPATIERAVGLSPGYAGMILRTDLAQREIEKLQNDADDKMTSKMAETRDILSGASPALAARMINIALGEDMKPETQLSACVQALKIAEGGGDGLAQATQFNIIIQGKNGEPDTSVDIFEGAAKLEDEPTETGRKALDMAKGDNDADES